MCMLQKSSVAVNRPRLEQLQQQLQQDSQTPFDFAEARPSSGQEQIDFRQQIALARQSFPDIDFDSNHGETLLQDTYGRKHNYLRYIRSFRSRGGNACCKSETGTCLSVRLVWSMLCVRTIGYH